MKRSGAFPRSGVLPVCFFVCFFLVVAGARSFAQQQQTNALAALATSWPAAADLPDAPVPTLAGVSDSQAQAPAATTPQGTVPQTSGPKTSGPQTAAPQTGSQTTATQTPQPTARQRAEEEMRRQERQRILGVVPNFNTSYNQDAPPLSVRQKFHLAFRSSVDPFQFVAAAFDAGISQAQNDYPGYGQGASGYFKRFGAAYADNFDGTIIGNALYPALLREDPRYFRRGTGSIKSRILYSTLTTVWTKNDNGTHGPNFANVLGNITAGGIANLYYPSTDRGVGLTFERAFTVTAEGTLGALFNEFWPDVSGHYTRRAKAKAP